MAPKQTGQTRKKMQKVQWNGVLYSKKDFLKLMHREFSDVVYFRMKGDKMVTPGKIKKADLEGWMEFSHARLV